MVGRQYINFFLMVKKQKNGGGQGRERDGSNQMPGTDHVASGPMRGLKKNCIRWRKQTSRQTDGHCNSMTESTQWGHFSKNYLKQVMYFALSIMYQTQVIKSGVPM